MNLKRVVFPVLATTLSIFCGFTAIGEESPLSLGSHFFRLGNYDAAITEYKRYLFFHPDDPSRGGNISQHRLCLSRTGVLARS